MRSLVRLFALFVGSAAPGQEPAALRVEGLDVPWIPTFEARATTAAPLTARTSALVALGWLRLANHARARSALAGCCAATSGDDGGGRVDPAWAAAATLWYLRATHDVDTARRHLQHLCVALARVGAGPPRARFADEAMLVHGMLCVAAIESFLDEAKPRTASAANGWARQAIRRWLEIEREAWQPGRGHFRPHLTAGAVIVPEPADASVLWPQAVGMLVASGDRATLHATAIVRQALYGNRGIDGDPGFATPDAAALVLCAATQFADPTARGDAWHAFVERRAATDPAIDAAALDLDAALFATTGVRLATGAGVDEGWLRVRPWLPPDRDRVCFRGLHAEGARFDLEIERRRGAPRPDEADSELAATTAPERLRVRVTIAACARPPVRLLLQGPAVQYVASLEAGESFARSLGQATR